MSDIARRLKDGSVGAETQRLQEGVRAQLDKALRWEKARPRKEVKGGINVAAGLQRVQAMQTYLDTSVKRLARLDVGGKERDAMLNELSEYQAKATQILRDVARHCKSVR
jgi:hypothetical protein